MNRRKLLKGFLGIGAALFGGRAVADPHISDVKVTPYAKYNKKPALALKAEHFEKKYWEAQRTIDELYEHVRELRKPIDKIFSLPRGDERWVHVCRIENDLYIDGEKV